MMKLIANTLSRIVISICFCTLSSCHTYTTFYNTTVSSIDTVLPKRTHRVDLSHKGLTQLPNALLDLPSIKMLNLSANRGLNLHDAFLTLKHPEKLRVLILDSLNINQLPKSILRFKNLKQLSLGYNPKLNLEATFQLIRNLPITFLNLKGNQINKLPQSVTQLQSIRDFNLSYNHIADSLSYAYLGQLPKLYSLWLDHNELSSLPASIGAIKKARFLYIDHNKLTTLPKEISNMAVWVIHAGYNKFKEFPVAFINMKKLLMIHINNNAISSFPEAYTSNKFTFKGLLLDNNPISEKERQRIKAFCKGFFLLSFQQKQYFVK